MKRFFLLLLLSLFLTITTFAQKNSISGAMMVEITDVIKTKKQFATVDIKMGYQQEVSFAYSFMDGTGSMFNLNYIGGWRFNRYFYAGIGTGLDFSGHNERQFVCEYMNGSTYRYITGTYNINDVGSTEEKTGKEYVTDYYLSLSNQVLAIPLYAHLRVYFMNTKWSPFLAFSAGIRLSASKKLDVYEASRPYWGNFTIGDYKRTEKYGAVTGMFEVLPGVSYQYSRDMAFNFQIGYATRDQYEIRSYNPGGEMKRDWSHGFTIRLGVVF